MSKVLLKSLVVTGFGLIGSAAVADTYFEQGKSLEGGDNLALGLITADRAGVVEIYDFATGTVGDLLGTETLHAGANPEVRVPTGLPVSSDVLAVVKIGGEVVAEKRFDIR